MQSIRLQLREGLVNFQQSKSAFRVLATVHPTTREISQVNSLAAEDAPRTLLILDSSFNPPSVAHQTLAETAISDISNHKPKPHRLLLLFSTMNADKAPSAADFDQRLTMMTMFAQDMLVTFASEKKDFVLPIDIGLTTAPYYTDKSRAIQTDGASFYPSQPKHIHLIGYDTLTRFFAAKYYTKFDPPFSALNPYFDAGHELRATLRPDNDYGTEEEQRSFLDKLRSGDLEHDGGRREWAEQVYLVPPNSKIGVSSTKIRKAAQAKDWKTVQDLCTPSVAAWVQSERLYEADAEGKKMA